MARGVPVFLGGKNGIALLGIKPRGFVIGGHKPKTLCSLGRVAKILAMLIKSSLLSFEFNISHFSVGERYGHMMHYITLIMKFSKESNKFD